MSHYTTLTEAFTCAADDDVMCIRQPLQSLTTLIPPRLVVSRHTRLLAAVHACLKHASNAPLHAELSLLLDNRA